MALVKGGGDRQEAHERYAVISPTYGDVMSKAMQVLLHEVGL